MNEQSRRCLSRRHRRSRPAHVRARLRRVERRQHQHQARRRHHPDNAEERVEGIHDAGHDGRRRISMGRRFAGTRDASSELLMHLEVYRNRPDVRAVVHAHPPIATGFAVAGIPLDRAVLAEVVTTLGSIPIAEYGTPSTPELPAAVRKYIKAHDGLLLANHGALTVGGDVYARVLQDGDDRALREDQSRDAAARAREPAVARRSARACRSCGATTASSRRRPSARTGRAAGGRRSGVVSDRRGAGIARNAAGPDGSGGFGRGNSAIIPRAYGPHRRCREGSIGRSAWVRRSAWSKPKDSSR